LIIKRKRGDMMYQMSLLTGKYVTTAMVSVTLGAMLLFLMLFRTLAFVLLLASGVSLAPLTLVIILAGTGVEYMRSIQHPD
jgi:hypothetical protein